MNDLDDIKKKVIYSRTSQSTYTSLPVEFPIGVGQVVSLIAVHWHIETLKDTGGAAIFVAALSENPEHEAAPPGGVAELHGNQSLYGMATFVCIVQQNAINHAYGLYCGTQVIPLYGLLRPKRQVAVFANVWAAGVTGIRGDIYYKEAQPSVALVDAINRRYGKYRRT